MNEMIEAPEDFEAPRIAAVRPGEGDYVVHVTWEDGSDTRVDLAEPVFAYKHFRPLRNVARFRTIDVEEWGWAISWGDDLDFSGEALMEMARAQEDAAMTASELRAWLKLHDQTQESAARLLGISKRIIAYYATGARPIPKYIVLALKGAAAELNAKNRPMTT